MLLQILLYVLFAPAGLVIILFALAPIMILFDTSRDIPRTSGRYRKRGFTPTEKKARAKKWAESPANPVNIEKRRREEEQTLRELGRF